MCLKSSATPNRTYKMWSTMWEKFSLWMHSFCDPLHDPSLDRCKYAKYREERKTTVRVLQEPVERIYSIGHVLGKGTYGLVKEGVERRTKRKVALKFVDRDSLTPRDEKLLMREAGILARMAHGHVVQTYGLYKCRDAYCLTLEYMAGGELFNDILRRHFYTEACARRVIIQVLDALAFLHRRGIIHRDIKPENLLLPRVGCQDVKLADFGFATVLAPPTYKEVEPVGTPGYAAPELLRLLPYDAKADIFSVGVIAYALLGGSLPFNGLNVRQVVLATLGGRPSFASQQWAATSEDAKSFVKLLMRKDYVSRPGAEEALSHPWMKVCGKRLRSNTLSEGRSGSFRSLLEEVQNQRKGLRKRMKAVVGVVLATNRFKAFLEEVNQSVPETLPPGAEEDSEGENRAAIA